MKIGIRNNQEFYSGLLFAFFGILAVVLARDYPMGSAMRMGPGYFPTILGSILALLGLLISARGLVSRGGANMFLAGRPMVFVFSAVLVFAFFIESLGLVLTTLALVVISRLAGEFRLREVIGLFFVLAVLAVGLFVYGLGLSFKAWPPW